MQLTVLDPSTPEEDFPALESALTEPDGLLAVGGCLSETRLITAYRKGIFPWYNEGDPILWWSPNPRMVLFPDDLIISTSLGKKLRKKFFECTIDSAFGDVIDACADSRRDAGTWISSEINQAYRQLHRAGIAHSAEAWINGELVGGLYGVAIGGVFFGESMFHFVSDASKVAFVHLVNQLKSWDYQLIDCQIYSNHLSSLGGQEIERTYFTQLLEQYCYAPVHPAAWQH